MSAKRSLFKSPAVLLSAIVLMMAWGISSVHAGTIVIEHQPLPLESGRTLPPTLRGVTVDSPDDVDELVDALSSHSLAPVVRLVFDPDRETGEFQEVIDRIRPYAWIMGQLADSTAMSIYSAEDFRQRATDFMEAYGDKVDLWEIGNELNGLWTGNSPEEINQKVEAAYDVVANQYHGKTLITLNYWSSKDCYEQEWEATLNYARTLPLNVRIGVDYVMLSIYETACSPFQHPTAHQISNTLVELGQIFPNARLGIGEIGAQGTSDNNAWAEPSFIEKSDIAIKYYGMQNLLRDRVGDRFAGGYFWWYYREDAIPKNREESLWPLLEKLLSNL